MAYEPSPAVIPNFETSIDVSKFFHASTRTSSSSDSCVSPIPALSNCSSFDNVGIGILYWELYLFASVSSTQWNTSCAFTLRVILIKHINKNNLNHFTVFILYTSYKNNVLSESCDMCISKIDFYCTIVQIT